jgi:hypothetical protein
MADCTMAFLAKSYTNNRVRARLLSLLKYNRRSRLTVVKRDLCTGDHHLSCPTASVFNRYAWVGRDMFARISSRLSDEVFARFPGKDYNASTTLRED